MTIAVLRLGHRPARDKRGATHVALTDRAVRRAVRGPNRGPVAGDPPAVAGPDRPPHDVRGAARSRAAADPPGCGPPRRRGGGESPARGLRPRDVQRHRREPAPLRGGGPRRVPRPTPPGGGPPPLVPGADAGPPRRAG